MDSLAVSSADKKVTNCWAVADAVGAIKELVKKLPVAYQALQKIA